VKQRDLPWKPSDAARLNARRVLPQLVRDYFRSGRKIDAASDPRKMHSFRLKTKRLRYTLEAFISVYGPGLQHRIDRLRPIQNALGQWNDCEVLLAEFQDKLNLRVQAYIRKTAGEKREEFLRYWREEFDSPDEEKKWQQYLTRPGRTNLR
jgi:CHAD domain-containing protein